MQRPMRNGHLHYRCFEAGRIQSLAKEDKVFPKLNVPQTTLAAGAKNTAGQTTLKVLQRANSPRRHLTQPNTGLIDDDDDVKPHS